MTRSLPLGDGDFDLIFHPVSSCCVREVRPIFREWFRLTDLYEDTSGEGTPHRLHIPAFWATRAVKTDRDSAE